MKMWWFDGIPADGITRTDLSVFYKDRPIGKLRVSFIYFLFGSPKAVVAEYYRPKYNQIRHFKISMFSGLPKPHPAYSCIAGLYIPCILAIIPIIEHTGTLFQLPDTIKQLDYIKIK
jgi:hypothetical protein